MCKIIAIANQKGGVAKTTTTTCLMNSITTIGNYYQAKVNHDMYGGGI